MAEPHPAFEAADAAHRFEGGSLERLWSLLQAAAFKLPTTEGGDGKWAWRVLHNGACVALRISPRFRKELRISRDAAPETDAKWEMFHRECRTFLEHFKPRGTWELVEEGDMPVKRPDGSWGTGAYAMYVENHEVLNGVQGIKREAGPGTPAAKAQPDIFDELGTIRDEEPG